MEEDEVDVLGDFCLNLETDLNHYDAGEFPAQNSELLGDYMQHPWLLENTQPWYFDHANDDKSKTLLMESMIHEEKKHFPLPAGAQLPAPINLPKVSPMWSKEDVESLRKGIELHSNNWGKVARMVGTKTTLQVKSYIKSHPELMASSAAGACLPPSGTPSPPQFINEVEVTNEESSAQQFSVEDIVNEAEIPASMEEVIATAASTTTTTTGQKGAGWSSPAKKAKPPPNQRPAAKRPRDKSSSMVKRGPGRPRKVPPSPSAHPPAGQDPVLLQPRPAPVLLGEVVRLQRPSEVASDTQSDSEVDIDCSDDEAERKLQRVQQPEPAVSLRPSESEAETEQIAVRTDSEECESQSETDTKPPDSSGAPQQPVFTFPAPLTERAVDLAAISEEERTVHWDFFEGRSSKTPERYLKIRNSILTEWRRVRPRYLTKTSVRPSLKNCGDVNCISRVHAYLELTGAINFGCDQVQYGRPLPPVPSHKERLANSVQLGPISAAAVLAASGLPARARTKKRPHPADGTNFEGNGGGYTISHDGTVVHPPAKPSKTKRKGPSDPHSESTDPFQLVPCVHFGPERPAPFRVKISAEALLVIDLHAHLCTTEVIGLLGGHFDEDNDEGDEDPVLRIEAAQPCRSQATNHQCEMCPVSQTESSEELRSRGLEVVGWYHSHPTFPALPSVRDVHTQQEFQEWFSRQEAPFVGIIVNPFPSSGLKASLKSMVRCVTVHDELPYKHDLSVIHSPGSSGERLERVRDTLDLLERTLDSCPTLVPLDSKYPHCLPAKTDGPAGMNYAGKAISSILAHLDKAIPPERLRQMEKLAGAFLERLIQRMRSQQ